MKLALLLILLVFSACSETTMTEINPVDSLFYTGVLTGQNRSGNSATGAIAFRIAKIRDSVTGSFEILGSIDWTTPGIVHGPIIDSAGYFTSLCTVSNTNETNRALRQMQLSLTYSMDSLKIAYIIGFVNFNALCIRM